MKYRVIERFRSQYSIGAMCKVFEVSRSGYYDWRKRQDRTPKDQWLVDLIVECQQKCKQTYGIRRVRRWLQKQKGKVANLKAILRIMTYIPIPNGMLYMCAVVDLCGRKVLAYRIAGNMAASLVADTIRDAIKQEKVTDGLVLHSDQGSQYTSQMYNDLSKEYHFHPSMSSPGCPYDNAVMENFFGTLKTECLYRMRFTTKSEVEQLVAEYVYFYNYERINLKNGLTPDEIRSKAA